MTQKTAEIEAAGVYQWEYRDSGSASLNHVLNEVEQLRAAQDAQWGGPVHDGTHLPADWLRFISKQVYLAEFELGEEAFARTQFENRMLIIAALAVAAIQSSRRKRG